MAHGDAREGKWRGNWRMEWVASTLHTTSEHAVSSITTADAHTTAASSRLNWRPRRFKWTRPFRRKTKSVFCACAITFKKQSTTCITSQKFPGVLWHMKVHPTFTWTHDSSLSGPRLIQMVNFHSVSLRFTTGYFKVSPSCTSPHQSSICNSLFTHTCHIPRPNLHPSKEPVQVLHPV